MTIENVTSTPFLQLETSQTQAANMIVQILEASENRVMVTTEKTHDQFAEYMSEVQKRFHALQEKQRQLLQRMKSCEEQHRAFDVNHPAEIAELKEKVKVSDEKLAAKVAEMSLKANESKAKIDAAIANESEYVRQQTKAAQDLADQNINYVRVSSVSWIPHHLALCNPHQGATGWLSATWLNNIKGDDNTRYEHTMASCEIQWLNIAKGSLKACLLNTEKIK